MTGDPRRTRPVVIIAVLIGVAAIAACGDIEDQSLCSAYGDFLDERASVRELDAESLSADEAAAVAEDYLDTVVRLQELDDRHETELQTLESAVRDVLRTLESVDEDEDYATWAPLVEDDLEVAGDAAVTVEEIFEPQCPNPGGEG